MSMNYSDHIEKSSVSAKVSEVFLTAGVAFQKLGDLTLQLNDSDDAQENMRWTESEMERLQNALYKFACEIDSIGQQVQQRTKKQIKTDVRRKLTVRDDLRALQAEPKRAKYATGKAVGAIQHRPIIPRSMPKTTVYTATPQHITYTTQQTPFDTQIDYHGPPAFD